MFTGAMLETLNISDKYPGQEQLGARGNTLITNIPFF